MVKTLADEYHGRKCHGLNRHRLSYAISSYILDGSLSQTAEDEVADSLYIVGEINHAEWLLAKERNDKRMGR